MLRIDPFLSDKIFNPKFDTEKNEKKEVQENINIRIKTELYNDPNYSPVYFHGENTPTAINSFLVSEECSKLKNELYKIKLHIQGWLNNFSIMIDIQYIENERLVHTTASANWVIITFFSRLIGDYYSDLRIQLYSSGKKNLEIIAILLYDENINIDTRKALLSNLLSDEGLLACGAGCYTRLSNTADYFITNLNTKKSISNWVYDYLLETADTQTRYEILDRKKNYVQLLCILISFPIEEMHIHARNFLLSFAANFGKFPFKIPYDPYLKLFEKNIGVKLVADNYLISLKNKISGEDLAIFIVNKIYSLIRERISSNSIESYAEQSSIIITYLDAIGDDYYFDLGEIFHEDATLKGHNFFEMTIVERLIQSGWLTNKRIYLSETYNEQRLFYKIFKNNLLLTWMKKRGDTRIRLTNIEINEEGLEDIKIFWDLFLTNEKLKPRLCCQAETLKGNYISHLYFPTKLFRIFAVNMNIKEFKGWDLRSICFSEYCFGNQQDNSNEIFKKIKLYSLRKIDFSNVNLSELSLTSLDFSESKFTKANLQMSSLINILFRSSDLSDINLRKSNLINVDFYNAKLCGANFLKIKAKKINLMHADLSSGIVKVDFKFSSLENVNFVSSNLQNADLRYANIINCDFTFANLDRVDFRYSNLDGSIFSNTILKNSKLDHASIRGADFENADLEGMNLANIDGEESKLVKANLKNTLLLNSKLKNSDLSGADLSGADLSGADLSGADLSGADLSGADLTRVNLVGAHILGANFLGAVLLDSNIEETYISNLISNNVQTSSIITQDILLNNEIKSEDFYEKNEENLEFSTFFYKNYAYSLKKTDIEAIGQIVFRNEENFFFKVLSSNIELISSFNQFSQIKSTKNCGIFIILREKKHWASLIIYFHQINANNPSIYFIDAFGQEISPATKRYIQDYYPRVTCIQLLESSPQTTLLYNSGLWSLENSINLKKILDNVELSEEYLQDSSSIFFIEEKLYGISNSLEKNYFENQRVYFSIELLKNPDRVEKFKNLLAISKVIDELEIEPTCLLRKVKRELSEIACLFEWEDIDKISLERVDNRDYNKIKIESTLFLDYLKITDILKRSQMLIWIDKNNIEIVGNKKNIIKRLIYIEKNSSQLLRLKNISERLNLGLFIDDTLIALLKGNTKSVITNLGFIGSNLFLSHLAKRIKLGGLELVKNDQFLIGNFLKSSAPFIQRGTAGFFAYDLINQIKLLEDGDKEAITNIFLDSLILGADIVETGIEVAELAEIEITLGMSGPVGFFLDGVITFAIFGSKLHSAFRTVSQLNHIIPLTTFEKFKEFWRNFLSLSSEAYIEELLDIVEANNQLLLAKLEFFKNKSYIKYYFYIPIEKIIDNCTHESSNCTKKVNYFIASDIDLCEKKQNSKWARGKPEKPLGVQFTCLPSGDYESAIENTYQCDNALGITYINNTISNISFFDLEDGMRYAHGFLDQENIFFIRNGFADINGGNKNDFFKLLSSSIVGTLNGKEGIDTLDLSEFFPLEKNITVDLIHGLIQYGPKELTYRSIEIVIGRKEHPETFIVACSTLELNTQGGLLEAPDNIYIPQSNNCNYSLKLTIHSNTLITSQALSGNFDYSILLGNGLITINLPLAHEKNTHKFFFNGTINDLESIAVKSSIKSNDLSKRYNITLHFLSANLRELINIIKSITFIKDEKNSFINVFYSFNLLASFISTDALLKAKCLPIVLNVNQHSKLLEKYQSYSNLTLNNTISDSQEVYTLVLNLMNKVNCLYLIENLTININSVSINNSYFYFSDGSFLKIGGENNIYIHYNSVNKTMNFIMHNYLNSAKRLNTIFSAYSEVDNESLISGYNKSQIMHMNPLASKNYFIANGGENVFIIDSGYEKIVTLEQIPIREIIIDSNFSSKYKDTIDFRLLFNQFQRDLNETLDLEIKRDTQEQKFENDIFMIPIVKNLKNITLSFEILKVRLKNVLSNKNYENIQFISNVAPMKISGFIPNLYLEPLPLEIEINDNLVILNANDIEKNTLIIFNKLFDQHEFLREADNLFITNILNPKIEKKLSTTIILNNYYKEEDIFLTLRINFFNKNLILKRVSNKINRAINLNYIYKNQVNYLENLLNQTELSKNKNGFITKLLNSNLTGKILVDTGHNFSRNSSNANPRIIRVSRSIGWIEEPITNGAGRSKGIVQAMISYLSNSFFVGKKKKLAGLTFFSNELALVKNSRTCSKNEAFKQRQCFQTTQLSTRLVSLPSRWTRPLLELGTGAIAGSVSEIFNQLIESYPSRVASLTVISTLLETLVVSSRYFLSSFVNNKLEFDDPLSPFAMYFACNLFITAGLRSVLMGLEYSNRPLCKQVKKGIQALYTFLFLQALFNFFTRDESHENKLSALSNLICHSGGVMLSRKLTHTALNSDFFKSNDETRRERSSQSRSPR